MLYLYAPGWLIPRATLSVIPEYLDTSPELCCLQIATAKAVPRVQDGLLLSSLVTLGMGLTLLDIRYSQQYWGRPSPGQKVFLPKEK